MSDSLLSSQDGVLKLTHDVRNFSEALSALKNVFLHYKGGSFYLYVFFVLKVLRFFLLKIKI